MTSADSRNDAPRPHRRRRDREATKRDLLDAARRLLQRDGVLAGLNLREVADEAGVNRGLIYQYFGSRQELLRAAIAEIRWTGVADRYGEWRALSFPERRTYIFDQALKSLEFIRLEALLALDGDAGDESVGLFPGLERSRSDMAADQAAGTLDPDLDTTMVQMLAASTYLGYCVFREMMARDAGVTPDELDQRALRLFERMMEGLAPRRTAG
jgi:AcrR family transcriptional regulator